LSITSYIFAKIKKTPLNNLVTDADNREILKGAGTTLILKITGLIFLYSFNIYLARLYGAEVMGLFALTLTAANIFTIFAKMGTQTSLVRFVAQYAGQRNFTAVKQIYNKTLQLVLPISIFLCIIFYFLSPFIANDIFHKSKLIIPLRITSFVLPFSTLIGVNTASLRGLKKIRDAFIFSTVLPPVLSTFSLIVFTYFIVKSYLTPIYVNLLTVFTCALYSLILWQKYSKKLIKSDIYEKTIEIKKSEIVKVSMTMFMTSAMLLIMGWTDTFMLGIFRSASEVGVYRISIQIALLTSFTLGAVNSIAAPKFSELYWKNENNALKTVTKFASKVVFLSALPVYLIIVLFSKQILGIFGKEFIAGSIALIILATGQFVNAACGSVGFLLDMTGNQKIFMTAMLIGGTLNIVLNFWLIPFYGIIGAALATAVSTAVWNILASINVYKIYGYWIGYYPGK